MIILHRFLDDIYKFIEFHQTCYLVSSKPLHRFNSKKKNWQKMARIQTELGIFWLGTLRFNIDIIIFLMIYVFMNGMECTNEMVITNV